MIPQNKDTYIFVIDTDTYSGNFERQLTAYCTGRVGECGIGEKYAYLFKNISDEDEKSLEEANVLLVADDHGCFRPTSIWPTPGYWNDGFGNHWPDEKWNSEEANEKWQLSNKEAFKEAPEYGKKTIGKYPAYQSVAIYFENKPSTRLINFLIKRSKEYKPISEFDTSFNIIGYRIIQQTTLEKEIWVYH